MVVIDTWLIVALAVATFVALAAVGLPIGLSLGLAGIFGLILLRDVSVAGATLGTGPYSAMASFGLAAVPMFIFMGALANYANIPYQIFDLATRLLRKVPGGLGMATLSACVGFASVTGSSVATAATIAKMSIPQLRRRGYTAQLSGGLVAAGGTLGILIPPSIGLVLFGVISGVSIGSLLIAGIIPGLLSALIYLPLIALLSTTAAGRTRFGRWVGAGITPSIRPPAEPEPSLRRGVTWPDISGVLRALILFVIVIGGIYSGIFTATESAAIGAFVALVMLLIHARGPISGRRVIVEALREGTATTSMVLLIVLGGSLFTFFLTSAGVPASVARWAEGLDISPTAIVIVLILLMIPLGMFLDPVSATLVTVPLTYPIVTSLGFDGLWWGIMTMKMLEFGMVTPPVGMNAFVVAASVEDMTAEDVFRGIVPFYVGDILTISLLFMLPEIVTFLPTHMS